MSRTRKLVIDENGDPSIFIDKDDTVVVRGCGSELNWLDQTAALAGVPEGRRISIYADYAAHFWRLNSTQREQLRRGMEAAAELRRRLIDRDRQYV